MTPTLFIFSGLPGGGKTTIARKLSAHLNCTHLRIDTIEQALRDLCNLDVVDEGYQLAYRLAADNLKIGNSVVADSCNPIQITRDEWIKVANDAGCRAINIEIVCSDLNEHRERVDNRVGDVEGLVLPNWEDVCRREYHPWQTDRIVLNTAGIDPDDALKVLLAILDQRDS